MLCPRPYEVHDDARAHELQDIMWALDVARSTASLPTPASDADSGDSDSDGDNVMARRWIGEERARMVRDEARSRRGPLGPGQGLMPPPRADAGSM